MTEEETIPSMMPSMAPAEDEEESAPMTDEEVAAKTQARLQKKLRVGDGEDILQLAVVRFLHSCRCTLSDS